MNGGALNYTTEKVSKGLLIIPPLLWIIIIFISLYWSIYQTKRNTISLVSNNAQGLFQLMETTRLWNASHGGVYVFITDKTIPNPYLDVPDRDITTVSGKHLTKINPAYMTRQIAEIAKKNQDILFHITSLKPIRPANKADSWESAALTEFEKGNKEKIELIRAGPQKVFMYMAPFLLKSRVYNAMPNRDIRQEISVEV